MRGRAYDHDLGVARAAREDACNHVYAGQEPKIWCRGRDLNPPQACLAIFQSRVLCSKVDPSCCQLKADVDAGPHLLSSGPSANARLWIPRGCVLPGVNGPAWILWEVGVEELVEPLAAHPGRKDERSVHPCQPSHGPLNGCVIRWASSTTRATPTRGVSNGPCSPSMN